MTADVRFGILASAYDLPTARTGVVWCSRWSAQQKRCASVGKMGASDASLPGKTATGWSASMSVPVKSAPKSPVSRLSTSNGCKVASPVAPRSMPLANGPPGMIRAVV